MSDLTAVAVIICDDVRKPTIFYYTKRGYGANKGLFEFPGGKIDGGEHPKTAAKREVREELGVDINIGHSVCSSFYNNQDGKGKIIFYLASIVNGTPNAHEADGDFWGTLEDLLLQQSSFSPADKNAISGLKTLLDAV